MRAAYKCEHEGANVHENRAKYRSPDPIRHLLYHSPLGVSARLLLRHCEYYTCDKSEVNVEVKARLPQ